MIKKIHLKGAACIQFIVLGLILLPSVASAATISKAYSSTGNISSGSIVSIDPSNTGGVIAANSLSSHLLGVVVTQNDSLITVNPSNSSVQVATGGSTPVLVTNLDGNINKGDYVSVSPLDGAGMKASSGLPVIGVAETAFSASNSITAKQIKDKSGKTTTVNIGYVRLTINIGSGSVSATNKGADLNGLQKTVQNLTGRTVPTIRIIISLVIAIVAIVSLATLIYGSIYGSIISIGRNPLAKSAIINTLRFVLIMAAISAIVAIITIDLLLH